MYDKGVVTYELVLEGSSERSTNGVIERPEVSPRHETITEYSTISRYGSQYDTRV